MKKIILSTLFLLISLLTFSQVNPVKVTDFFADFEIKPYNGNVMDTVYNTGVDVILPVFMRFKLKGPYGSGNFTMIPQKSYASIMYEHANGFEFNPTGNSLDLSRNEWRPMPGSIYSPYVKVDLLLYKEYLKSGKLKTHFMSVYDAVNNSWNPGIVAVANYKRNITVVQVPNFIGPNQICSEAIFTIERPDVVTLENASGIATLTALGNNQWKVTRTGTASGPTNLVSTSNGKVYKMNIHVGPMFQGQIDGDVALKRGWSRDYSLFATGGPYTNYKWTISDNRITMVPNGTTVKLSVPVSYQVSDPMEGDWITLKCTMNSECGPVSTSMQINIMPL